VTAFYESAPNDLTAIRGIAPFKARLASAGIRGSTGWPPGCDRVPASPECRAQEWIDQARNLV
jgi:hypothetical protein